MKISQSEFNTMLRGYQIIDCIVHSKVALHFVGRNIEEGAKAGVMSEWKATQRAVSFFTDEPYGKGLGTVDLENFETTYCGACKLFDGSDQVVFISSTRQVFSRGGGI